MRAPLRVDPTPRLHPPTQATKIEKDRRTVLRASLLPPWHAVRPGPPCGGRHHFHTSESSAWLHHRLSVCSCCGSWIGRRLSMIGACARAHTTSVAPRCRFMAGVCVYIGRVLAAAAQGGRKFVHVMDAECACRPNRLDSPSTDAPYPLLTPNRIMHPHNTGTASSSSKQQPPPPWGRITRAADARTTRTRSRTWRPTTRRAPSQPS